MKKLILGAAIVAALAGCAAPQPSTVRYVKPPDYSVAAEAEDAVRATRDDYKKTVTFEGPNISGNDNYLMLRAIKGTSTVVWQVYAADIYSAREWHFYQDAFDKDGAKLPFTSISRQVVSCRGGCTYAEHMGVLLTRAYLDQAAAKDGVAMKLGTRVSGAGWEIKFPPGYVAGFLAAVDKAP